MQVLVLGVRGVQELPSRGVQPCAYGHLLPPAPGLAVSQLGGLDVFLQQTPGPWGRAVAWEQPDLFGRWLGTGAGAEVGAAGVMAAAAVAACLRAAAFWQTRCLGLGVQQAAAALAAACQMWGQAPASEQPAHG